MLEVGPVMIVFVLRVMVANRHTLPSWLVVN